MYTIRLRRGHDAPLIGERAATRGRSATEGGDERAGGKTRASVAHRNARAERGDQGRARSATATEVTGRVPAPT
jgi:hypothetical protein